jgi:hypothetical protein
MTCSLSCARSNAARPLLGLFVRSLSIRRGDYCEGPLPAPLAFPLVGHCDIHSGADAFTRAARDTGVSSAPPLNLSAYSLSVLHRHAGRYRCPPAPRPAEANCQSLAPRAVRSRLGCFFVAVISCSPPPLCRRARRRGGYPSLVSRFDAARESLVSILLDRNTEAAFNPELETAISTEIGMGFVPISICWHAMNSNLIPGAGLRAVLFKGVGNFVWIVVHCCSPLF